MRTVLVIIIAIAVLDEAYAPPSDVVTMMKRIATRDSLIKLIDFKQNYNNRDIMVFLATTWYTWF